MTPTPKTYKTLFRENKADKLMEIHLTHIVRFNTKKMLILLQRLICVFSIITIEIPVVCFLILS